MKWNYEKCKAEALKYKTRKELQLNNPSIYAKIKGSKWFELYNHMKTKNNWSYEECKIEALKYNTRRELMDNNITIHSKICRNKWYELYQHMERLNYWTYEECREEALKYKTKKDLKINNHKIYDKISQEKWYELYEHTEIIGNKYKRLIYAYEFPDNFCYIGLTFNMDIRNNQHFSDKTSYVFIHNKETNLIPKLVIKSNYIDVEKAAILEGEIKAQYEKNGWNILNKIKVWRRAREDRSKFKFKMTFLLGGGARESMRSTSNRATSESFSKGVIEWSSFIEMLFRIHAPLGPQKGSSPTLGTRFP